MKRCPQCEFIYEDEQSLCDMDGVLLVYDSRLMPNLHALATVPPAPKGQRLNRAVPAFATVILALVLGMVYYVSTRPKAYTPPPIATIPASIPAPQDQPTASEQAPAASEVGNPEETVKEEPKPVTATKPPATAPAKKATTKATANSQTQKSTTEKKDDSKVGSILKKTGRILKKPFKF